MSIFPKRNGSWTLDGENLFAMFLKFNTIISPLVSLATSVCFSTKVIIRIRYKGVTPMVSPFESLGGKLKSFYVVMVVATLALGSRPKQGVGRWQAEMETRESLHMLLGM
jgi:hypothetical protein